MIDPLSFLWPLVDAPEPVIAAHAAANWPAGVCRRLVDEGFLVPADNAARIVCPECHNHEEEVVVRDGPDGRPRYFLPCPQVLRAEARPEALQRWRLDPSALAEALGTSLHLTGQCKELAPGRLWRIGRTNWQGTSRDVLFARGLHWNDAATIRAEIVRARKPVVFVASRRPEVDFWQRRIPSVLTLSDVANCTETGMEIDRLEMAAAIQAADAAIADPPEVALTQEQLKLTIRRQMKAERKMELTDDVFVAAYRQCLTLRAAAAYLSEATEQTVTKDKVKRALDRAGGVTAVLSTDDSDSVVRSVASQRRDNRGKSLIQSKPQPGE